MFAYGRGMGGISKLASKTKEFGEMDCFLYFVDTTPLSFGWDGAQNSSSTNCFGPKMHTKV